MQELALDEIRKKVIYQNTVDIWIAVCQEQGTEWHDTEKYKKFIGIKESGGDYQRGQDKTTFGENLSESNDENSAAYTIKLNDNAINIIRNFEP